MLELSVVLIRRDCHCHPNYTVGPTLGSGSGVESKKCCYADELCQVVSFVSQLRRQIQRTLIPLHAITRDTQEEEDGVSTEGVCSLIRHRKPSSSP